MEKMSTSEQVEEPPSLLGEAPASWSGALGPTVLSSSDRAASESGHWLIAQRLPAGRPGGRRLDRVRSHHSRFFQTLTLKAVPSSIMVGS